MRKLLALLLVLALLAPYTSWADSGTFYPDDGTDDGYWFSSSSYSNSTGGIVTGTTDFNSFVMFEDVTIPQGATISSAFIRYTCHTSYSGTTNTTIYFEDADTAVACTSHADCDGKSTTTGTAWNFTASWSASSTYDSPDISSEVQEVVDRGSWSSGNDMQLLWWFNSGDTYRMYVAYNYHGDGTDVPELHVTWTTGGSSWTLDVGDTAAANIGEIGDTPIANVDKFGGTDGTP